MVPQPFYNEPGYEHHQYENKSQAYTKNIREECVRWAMIDQLEHPKPGFEEVWYYY